MYGTTTILGLLAICVSTTNGAVSHSELPWEEYTDSDDYDYTGTIKFCRKGRTFGYRLDDDAKCGDDIAPLIRMQAGNSYLLRLENQGNEATNLHTHGLHIPGEGNADDMTRIVNPGNCLYYNYTIPADHSDGTFWYHPHLHGYTRKQVNGGAYGMMIIDPPEGATRPSFFDTEHLVVISNNDSDELRANELVQETLSFQAGVWQYLRILVVDPVANLRSLNFDSAVCQVHSVAHDGVYRSQVPNPTAEDSFSVTGASRLDLAVSCTESSGLYYATTDYDITTPLVAFDVPSGSSSSIATLPSTWTPERPDYLIDLTSIDMDTTFEINLRDVEYDLTTPLETFEYGSVQQWNLVGTSTHIFHLHGYHMQIVDGCGGIYEAGEWFDTISSEEDCLVRFPMVDFGGRAMIHCHILSHEDNGMMGWVDVENGPEIGTTLVDEVTC